MIELQGEIFEFRGGTIEFEDGSVEFRGGLIEFQGGIKIYFGQAPEAFFCPDRSFPATERREEEGYYQPVADIYRPKTIRSLR